MIYNFWENIQNKFWNLFQGFWKKKKKKKKKRRRKKKKKMAS